MRYKVDGHVYVSVSIYVDADSKESAIEEAYNQLNTLDAFVGNGDTDKLIGVDIDEASVSCDDEIKWTEATEEDDEDDEDG